MWSDYLLVFDKWAEFCEKLLGANFMVIGRSSLSLFLFVK